MPHPRCDDSRPWKQSVTPVTRYSSSASLITIVSCLSRPDKQTSSYTDVIVPAAAIGVLGLVAMAMMTRASRTLSRAAGAAPVPERTQTAALALACLLPFGVGIAWVVWALWAAHHYPVPANGFPFGHQSASWKFAILFSAGAVSTLGGPLLGIVIGRWFPQRGAAPLSAVVLVAAVIIMQGLFEPLRRIRVIMPWTSWGGPFGTTGDSNRTVVLTGSPQWWVAYLVSLCALATVAALWHDPEARTPRLRIVAAVLIVAAVVTCLLAMFTGLGHTLVNPLHSS